MWKIVHSDGKPDKCIFFSSALSYCLSTFKLLIQHRDKALLTIDHN